MMKKSVYALQNHNWATTGCFCVCDLQRWSHSRGACEWCVCVFSGWRALKGHFFSFFFCPGGWVGWSSFFFFTQLLCCRGMIGVWVSDHQKKKKKNPLQNRRRAQKHCSKKRAKGSCDRSRCARWPDFHNQEEDFFIIIFFTSSSDPRFALFWKMRHTYLPLKQRQPKRAPGATMLMLSGALTSPSHCEEAAPCDSHGAALPHRCSLSPPASLSSLSLPQKTNTQPAASLRLFLPLLPSARRSRSK